MRKQKTMKTDHICSIIAMISVMFISGCVGYPQQTYPHYSAPIYAQPSMAIYGGYASAPHPVMQSGRDYRDYGNYRSHDSEHAGGRREEGHEGRHEER
jgi:hypothetical protein